MSGIRRRLGQEEDTGHFQPWTTWSINEWAGFGAVQPSAWPERESFDPLMRCAPHPKETRLKVTSATSALVTGSCDYIEAPSHEHLPLPSWSRSSLLPSSQTSMMSFTTREGLNHQLENRKMPDIPAGAGVVSSSRPLNRPIPGALHQVPPPPPTPSANADEMADVLVMTTADSIRCDSTMTDHATLGIQPVSRYCRISVEFATQSLSDSLCLCLCQSIPPTTLSSVLQCGCVLYSHSWT